MPRSALRVEYERFCIEQANWLEDYALFRALKARYNGAWYLEWPEEYIRREPAALNRAQRDLAEPIRQVCFAQFLLFRQGERLRKYARAAGVFLIGDLPFFVSPDSSDVWANPELFLLDEGFRPRFVAGVPPIISAHKDNSGETRFMIGMCSAAPAIAGALIVYVRF
jgi:4-alpha-glucanotransferase